MKIARLISKLVQKAIEILAAFLIHLYTRAHIGPVHCSSVCVGEKRGLLLTIRISRTIAQSTAYSIRLLIFLSFSIVQIEAHLSLFRAFLSFSFLILTKEERARSVLAGQHAKTKASCNEVYDLG